MQQLKKLKRLNEERITLANYLTKKLQKINWLTPPLVHKNNVHTYYTYPLKFVSKKIGITRATFAKAMEAEGFELGQGYQEPLYLFPAYQNKEIYPHSHFPFISKEYPHTINYRKGICEVAERMYEKELICTNICQPPQTKKDIDEFVGTLEKIEKNLEMLKDYEKTL